MKPYKTVIYSFLLGGLLALIAQAMLVCTRTAFTGTPLEFWIGGSVLLLMGVVGCFLGGFGNYQYFEEWATFGSLLEAHGINIFVLVFTSWVSGTCWNVAYQNPASAGLIKMCDPSLDFATASKGSYAYCIINLIAMTCSVPLWMALGLL